MKKYAMYMKYILTIFMLIFIIKDVSGDSVSDAEIETVKEAVNKVSGFAESTESDARALKRFYGLNATDYEGVVYYAPEGNMDVDELLIVKLKDVAQSETVEEAVQERLDTQLKSFEGYGVEQVALLNEHALNVEGNYIFFIVGEQADQAQKAFLESL